MELVDERLERHLNELQQLSLDELLAARYAKFRNIAQFYTTA
jgi:acetyl-CoA carboxylase carboxyl transferase subunit alpha